MGTSSFSGGISPACSGHGWDWGASDPWGRSAGFEASSLSGSRAWRPGPVYLCCGHSLEEGAEECGAGIGLASSSSGSAQLQLRDCFYLFVTITSVRADSTRLQPTAPRGQQAANPGASPGTKICVVKRMEHPQRQVCECLRGRRCIPRIFCCRHGWLCSMRSLGWTQCLLQLFLAG